MGHTAYRLEFRSALFFAAAILELVCLRRAADACVRRCVKVRQV